MGMKEANRQTLIRLIRDFEKTRGVPTASKEAVRYSLLEEVKRLIANGADVNAKGENGVVALMLATDRKCAQILLDHGADVNAQDQYGRTPLIGFLMGLDRPARAEAYVKFLLKAGARAEIAANDGTTAFTLAREKYGPRVADLLTPPGGVPQDAKNAPERQPRGSWTAFNEWTYYCPYDSDAEAALQRLRQEVFLRGEYSLPGDELAEMDDKSLESNPPSVDKLRKLVAIGKALDQAMTQIGADTADSQKRTRELESFLDKAEQDGYTAAVRTTFGPNVPRPKTIEEALERADEAGTRSILDIDHVADAPASGVATPLVQSELIRLFGTGEPTLQMAQSAQSDGRLGDCVHGCWSAVYFRVYLEGKPHQYVFVGRSGE
jgi:hypothetical protein